MEGQNGGRSGVRVARERGGGGRWSWRVGGRKSLRTHGKVSLVSRVWTMAQRGHTLENPQAVRDEEERAGRPLGLA